MLFTSTSTQPPRVLIVEDEGLIAHDISQRLERAGYSVAGIAESGDDTLRKVEELKPDLVLMDIRIKGEMDGVETAAIVHERFDLPIIYLTAHSDSQTLDRAKVTGTFGYLTKPLQQATLQTSIEIALYKHRIERELRQQRAWLATILEVMAEAVIVTDSQQRVQFLNAVAEQLTGWTSAEAKGRKLLTVLEIFDHNLEHLAEPILDELVLEDRRTLLPRGLTGMNRSGHAFVLEGEIASSLEGDELLGIVVTFRDVTERHKEQQLVRHENKMQAVGSLASGAARDFNSVLAAIKDQAEQALLQPSRLPASRAQWENVLRSLEGGYRLTEKLVVFGYVWAA